MQDFIGKERACVPEGGQEINSDLWMSLLMALLRQRMEGPPQLFSFGSLRLLADHLLPHLIDNSKTACLAFRYYAETFYRPWHSINGTGFINY